MERHVDCHTYFFFHLPRRGFLQKCEARVGLALYTLHIDGRLLKRRWPEGWLNHKLKVMDVFLRLCDFHENFLCIRVFPSEIHGFVSVYRVFRIAESTQCIQLRPKAHMRVEVEPQVHAH